MLPILKLTYFGYPIKPIRIILLLRLSAADRACARSAPCTQRSVAFVYTFSNNSPKQSEALERAPLLAPLQAKG